MSVSVFLPESDHPVVQLSALSDPQREADLPKARIAAAMAFQAAPKRRPALIDGWFSKQFQPDSGPDDGHGTAHQQRERAVPFAELRLDALQGDPHGFDEVFAVRPWFGLRQQLHHHAAQV